MDEKAIKSFIKDYLKKSQSINVRYVKIRVINDRGGNTISVGIYLDKPIRFELFSGLISGLETLTGSRDWWVYAPHGKEIRLTSSQKAPSESGMQSQHSKVSS